MPPPIKPTSVKPNELTEAEGLHLAGAAAFACLLVIKGFPLEQVPDLAWNLAAALLAKVKPPAVPA